MINKRLQVLAIGLLLLSGNCLARLTSFEIAAVDGTRYLGLPTVQRMIGNATQEEKDTALIIAVLNNDLDMVQYLVENGASVNAFNGLALRAADDRNYLAILTFLQDRGASQTAFRWYQASLPH